MRGDIVMQPESIRKFTLFYLGSVIVMCVATFMNFDGLLNEARAQAGERLAFGVVVASLVVWAGILLLLWYLIARKGFAVAKWLFIAFFLFNLLTSFGILAGGLALAEVAALLSLVLQAAAVYFLVQPDAKAWFSGERATASPED
jgi:hypothetical protein